jgi:hypothetical protein
MIFLILAAFYELCQFEILSALGYISLLVALYMTQKALIMTRKLRHEYKLLSQQAEMLRQEQLKLLRNQAEFHALQFDSNTIKH